MFPNDLWYPIQLVGVEGTRSTSLVCLLSNETHVEFFHSDHFCSFHSSSRFRASVKFGVIIQTHKPDALIVTLSSTSRTAPTDVNLGAFMLRL